MYAFDVVETHVMSNLVWYATLQHFVCYCLSLYKVQLDGGYSPPIDISVPDRGPGVAVAGAVDAAVVPTLHPGHGQGPGKMFQPWLRAGRRQPHS